jgi:hypothetical protein
MQIMKKKVQKKSHLLSQQHGIQHSLPPVPLPTFSFWDFLHREQPCASLLSYEAGGGNLQQRILLQLRVPKTSRTWGKKCRKSEEQSIACQILLTERQGQNVLLLETKQ